MTALRGTLLALLLSTPVVSNAHPTWFLPGKPINEDRQLYQLGTGHRFPQSDHAVPSRNLQHIRCTDGSTHSPDGRITHRLPAHPIACWARLKTFNIELSLQRGLKHFTEQRVSDEHKEQLSKDGRLRETYFKLAQTRLLPADYTGPFEDQAVMLQASSGANSTARLVRDGQPVGGRWISLACPSLPVELWRQTSADGSVDFASLLQPLANQQQNPQPEFCLLHSFETSRRADDQGFQLQFVSSPWEWSK